MGSPDNGLRAPEAKGGAPRAILEIDAGGNHRLPPVDARSPKNDGPDDFHALNPKSRPTRSPSCRAPSDAANGYLSIELARINGNALCVARHPGTVDSRLSEPFQASVPEGNLFSPDYAAGRLLAVLDGLDAKQSGNVFSWDGKRIPF